MSLLAEVAALGAPTVVRCPIALLEPVLEHDEVVDLHTLLADAGVPGARLGKVLRARGHEISDNAIVRHRRGVCRCA